MSVASAPLLDREGLTFPPQGRATGAKAGSAVGSSPKKRPRDPARRAEKYLLRDTMGRLLPDEAVATCGKWVARQFGADAGEPWARIKLGSEGACWSGLVSCGSVWHCPVCAAKIAGERREEVRLAIERAQAAGLSVWMATFTMPHHAFQAAGDLVGQVALGFRQVIAGAPWQRARERARYAGAIRSLEVTHGDNGWHPHLHVLVMLEPGAEALERGAELARFMFQRWSAAIARAGFGECDEKAWKFERCETPEQAGDYVSKWGPDWELTHAHLKDGKRGGRSPWRMLRDYAEHAAPRDAALLIEYAEAFKGRRQLTWSKGLKARFKIGDAEDAELAEREPSDAKPVVEVHEDAVRLIVRHKGAMARALEVLELHGVPGLYEFLERLGVNTRADCRLVVPAEGPPDDYQVLVRYLGVASARRLVGVEYV